MKKIVAIFIFSLIAGQVFSQAKVVHLDEEKFKNEVFDYEKNETWIFKGDKPAIIDFYADWCSPCRMTAPILEDLAKEYNGKIRIYKIDTQKEQNLAALFGVRSLPTILFIPKNGKPRAATGYMTKDKYVEIIADILKVNK